MAQVLLSTPAEQGYTFPAEWEPHAATWFSWPRPEGISFPQKYEPIPANMAAIMRQIAPRERVEINVPTGEYEAVVRQELQRNDCPLDNVFFHHIKTNETWCRDHGPAFVVRTDAEGRRELAIVDWGFNAWGGKYTLYEDDDEVPTRIADELGLPVFLPGIIMEGGAVDFNGAGTVLTTESCLLTRTRNPQLSKKRIEQYVRNYYGQKHVIWLGDGIVGDDTDGHVDDMARFINPTTVVVAVEEDPRDANYGVLQDNLRRLRAARDQDGNPLNVVPIPMPGFVSHNAQRLPASYANFYFINGALLVPTYRHKANDARAIETLQQHLPGRQVIGIDCVELIWGLGAIHCVTQQQPAV